MMQMMQGRVQARRVTWLDRNPLLRLPIAVQLTLGFVVAALIAASAAAVPSLGRAQTLQNQTSFYQFFVSKSTLPASANQDLQNIQANVTLINKTASQESLYNAVQALDGAVTDFGATVTAYARDGLIANSPVQAQFLQAAGHGQDSARQQARTQILLQDWQIYASLQSLFLPPLKAAQTKGSDGTAIIPQSALTEAAASLAQGRAVPAITDVAQSFAALSALNGQIVSGIALQSATAVAGQQVTVTAAVSIALAVLGIALVGLFISNSLARRLTELRRVTLAVEDGQFDERARVAGRDELARVSTSVNGMLDTIVGLLEETRRQRDALTNAADRLFADMRLAGAGDLRVNARVSNDPVGMLSNAFNLTIGRFRRFIMRTQTTLDQLDVIARRENQRTHAFATLLRDPRAIPPSASGMTPLSPQWDQSGPLPDAQALVVRARELLHYTAREGATAHVQSLLEGAEVAYLSVNRLNQLVSALTEARSPSTVAHLAQLQGQELTALEGVLRRLGNEAFAAQKASAAGLNELNTTIEQMSVATRAQMLPGRGVPGDANSAPLQATGGFVQEMADLAAELLHVVQEMRTGLASFRLESDQLAQGQGQGPNYAPNDYYAGQYREE